MVGSKKSRQSVGRILLVTTVVCGWPLHALAAECRTLSTVKDSGVADNNTGSGGHLTQHILGKTPPPQPASGQAGKTLYTSPEAYLGVWRNYESKEGIPSLNCSGTSAYHEVPVNKVLGSGVDLIGAFSCDSTNADGTCKDKRRTQCDKLAFGFILSPQGRWILNTSFPVNCKS
ncbi:hypothetical protein [Melittangium boletus]|uniref:hypothetical protein n=1 Tax=Melittangium boletus TaxID=83453 RepID=UPI003DA42B51